SFVASYEGLSCRTCLNCVSIRRFEIEVHPGNGNQERRVSRDRCTAFSRHTQADSIRLLHCPQGMVSALSTAFSISANRRGLLMMKKFNLMVNFVLGVCLKRGLPLAAWEIFIGYANISARVSPLWIVRQSSTADH